MDNLEKFHAAIGEMLEHADDLAAIARALNRIGLGRLADEIAETAAVVANNSKAARDAWSREMNNQADASLD